MLERHSQGRAREDVGILALNGCYHAIPQGLDRTIVGAAAQGQQAGNLPCGDGLGAASGNRSFMCGALSEKLEPARGAREVQPRIA